MVGVAGAEGGKAYSVISDAVNVAARGEWEPVEAYLPHAVDGGGRAA